MKALKFFILLIYMMLTISPLFSTTVLWTDKYDSGNNDYGNSIAVDADGNVYVAGSVNNGTDYDYFTIKYNSAGAIQWTKKYDSGSADYGYGIAVDTAGNVYVTGASHNGTYYDYFTIKYNSAGVIQWTNRYNSGAHDWGKGIAVDSAGNVYVTGSVNKAANNDDFFTIKYNSAGAIQWTNRYSGGAGRNDSGKSIAVDAAGNIFATGYSANSTDWDYFTIKYTNGAVQWTNRYGSVSGKHDWGNGIAVDTSGNVYVTGYAYNSSSSNSDYFTIKYNNAGAVQWTNRYGSGGIDHGNDIAVDTSGNVYVTGYAYNSSSSNNDYFTIIYNSVGGIQWTNRYDSGDDDSGEGIAVDTSGNIYITGSVYNGSTYDIYTICLEKPISHESKESNFYIPLTDASDVRVTKTFQSMNDADSTSILFQAQESGDVTITIYDLLGRKIREIKQTVNSGFNSIPWDFKDDDGKQVSSEVYVIRVKGVGVDKYLKIAVYR